MLSAMLEVLGDLDPKLHITVISADPEDTRKRHGVDAVGFKTDVLRDEPAVDPSDPVRIQKRLQRIFP